MKIVIDIPEVAYELLQRKQDLNIAESIIANGTPLPKGHGRLIDADALKIKLKERKNNFTKGWEQKDRIPKQEIARVDEISLIINIIDNAPTVERPTGEWIEGEYGNIKCNKCGCEIRYAYLIGNIPDYPKFCCDCGAKMKKGGVKND